MYGRFECRYIDNTKTKMFLYLISTFERTQIVNQHIRTAQYTATHIDLIILVSDANLISKSGTGWVDALHDYELVYFNV